MKKFLFIMLSLYPVVSFAHDGHVTAQGPFHYLEHYGVVFIVLAVVALFAVAKKSKEK